MLHPPSQAQWGVIFSLQSAAINRPSFKWTHWVSLGRVLDISTKISTGIPVRRSNTDISDSSQVFTTRPVHALKPSFSSGHVMFCPHDGDHSLRLNCLHCSSHWYALIFVEKPLLSITFWLPTSFLEQLSAKEQRKERNHMFSATKFKWLRSKLMCKIEGSMNLKITGVMKKKKKAFSEIRDNGNHTASHW